MAGIQHKNHLSRDEQILLGLEYLALGHKYLVCRDHEYPPWRTVSLGKKVSVDELSELVDSLNEGIVEDVSLKKESTTRKYRNYLNVAKELAPSLGIELGRGIIEGYKKSLPKLVSFYASKVCYQFNEAAVQVFLKNRNPKFIKDNPEYSLYYIVLFRYAIHHRFPVSFEYHNYNEYTKISQRKILPDGLSCNSSHLFVFGTDLGDGVRKRFLLSCINCLFTDLAVAFSNPENLSITRPSQSEIASFLKEEFGPKEIETPLDFLIRFQGLSYRKVLKTYDFPLIETVVEDKDLGTTTLKIQSKNRDRIFALLWEMGEEAKIIAPEIIKTEFQKRLEKISSQYKD